MVEPSSISNANINSNASHKKPRKVRSNSTGLAPAGRWRTEAKQQIYSLKLIDAVLHLRRHDSADATVRAVRDAADRVLALSAKGRTHWSRALLTRRFSLRLSQIKRKHKTVTRPDSGFIKPAVRKKVPPLQRKVRVLSQLVPRCRKLSLLSLLKETTAYIAALEMQVKAMALLTGLLNGAVPGSFLATGDQYFSSF